MNLKKGGLKKIIKIKLKCFLTLVIVFSMILSLIPNTNVFATENFDYTYSSQDTYGTEITSTTRSTVYNYKYTGEGTTGPTVTIEDETGDKPTKLFKVIDTNTTESTVFTYCTDFNTSMIKGHNYNRVSIDNADYYQNKNFIVIKEILKNSYPYIPTDKIEEKFKTSGITGLLESEAIAATQLAIWYYTNGKMPIFNSNDNVNKLYNKLINLQQSPDSVEEAEIVTQGIIVSPNGANVNVEFIFKADKNNLNGTSIDLDYEVNINGNPHPSGEIKNPPNNQYTDENGYTHIEITDIPLGSTIEFIIAGTQIIRQDTFYYGPEGGVKQSQSMVGADVYSANIERNFIYEIDSETEASLVASKRLEGNKPLKAGMFSFELLDYKGEVLETVKNSADGNIQFTPRTYKKPGTYTYKIREVDESLDGTILNGITYDKNVYEVTVNVNYDNKGELVARVVYPNGGITFTNKYEAKEISKEIEATKKLTGKKLEAEEFSFELLDYQGKVLETVKNNADGEIKFTPRTYKKAGTYTYKIREVDGSSGGTTSNGITYDTNVYDVEVIVTDDGNGNLVANVVYPKDDGITFTNKYEAKETSAEIEATKKLTGKKLEAEEFSFELLDYQGKELETVKNNADGKIKFTPRTYKKAGTYTYKIREVDKSSGGTTSNGITYDTNVYEVKVKVTDDGNGNLVANVVYPKDDGITFTNKYKAKEASVSLEATKVLEGKDLKADMFSFKLLDLNEKGEVVETVKNDVEGKIKFKTLKFDAVGIYHYQIVEVNKGLGGMTYDSQPLDVIIKVTDNGEGQLVAAVSYPVKEKPEFKNSYKAGSTSAAIEATKVLAGKDLEAGMFSFELLDKDNKVLKIAKNSKNGKVHFEAITYDEIGTYKYKLREVESNLGGITYDESEFEVTVKVTDDGKGNLVSEVVYPRGGVVFNNSYEAGTTSEAIEGTKELTGKDLEAGMFSFELVDKDNPDNVLQTVKNSANGKIHFEAITYDKVGDYKYKVREVKDTLSGIIYDKNEFEVTVKVTDDGKGNLESKVIYPEGGVSFKNTVIEGKLEFTKTDVSTGNVIDGAKIKITCIEGLDKGKVIEFTSSKEGNKFELKAGKYTFEETQAPEGYELTKEVGTFEIKENGEIVKVELKNYPIKGSAKLIKVDKDDDEKRIQGAKFVLLGSDKETIIAENLVTDSEGKIIVSNLEPGTYYFKETEAASGYILDETLIEVKVESNQQTISTVTFENEKEEEGGGLPDIDPEGDIPEEEGGSPDTDSNVSSPNTNTNNNTNSNVNSSTNSSGSSPKTSDTSIAGYTISGIVAIGTLVGINRKRKDK